MARRTPYIVCFAGDEPVPEQPAKTDCPQWSAHTPRPAGYIGWHAWARRMSRTHRQLICSGCGRYKVWVEKGGARQHPRNWRELVQALAARPEET